VWGRARSHMNRDLMEICDKISTQAGAEFDGRSLVERWGVLYCILHAVEKGD
jgi:hypothetical protein